MIESPTLTGRLIELAGEAAVTTDDAARYEIDGRRPAAVVAPAHPDDAARVLAFAARQRLAVAPVGGATALGLGGTPARYDVALSTRRLDAVVEYEPADLTVTVGAGMTLDRLAELLAAHGQFVPIEAPQPERATVGGAIARNTSGPFRTGYGSLRDSLLGIRFAAPNGEVVMAGSRVVKNVAGYDLPKLFIGSLGTLGAVTEASFKVFPLPRDPLTLLYAVDSSDAAAALVRAARGARLSPIALDLYNEAAAARLAIDRAPWALAVAVAGIPASLDRVERTLAQLATECGARSVARLARDEHRAFWRAANDLGHGDSPATLGVAAGVAPARTIELAATLGAIDGGACAVVARPAVGVLRVRAWPPAAPADVASLAGQVRQAALALGGHAVVEVCPAESKQLLDVWGAAETDVALARRIRDRFDPDRTLNPGRFVGGD